MTGAGRVHDLLGVGVGPFNLGLACLAEPLGLDAVFLERRGELRWHPGMLLDDAVLQVPFLADLVTMADPTSRYSFLNYLKQHGRLYPFYVRESFYPLRRGSRSSGCRPTPDGCSRRWSRDPGGGRAARPAARPRPRPAAAALLGHPRWSTPS